MTSRAEHQDLERRARDLYRQAVADVDTVTAGRLRATRREALAGGSRAHHRLRWMMPTGALAATLLAAVLVWHPLQRSMPTAQQSMQQSADTADSDLPPDPDSANPAVVEDMGFYAWLAQQQPANQRRR